MTQFCIEEAAYDYVEQRDVLHKTGNLDVPVTSGKAADPEWSDAMAKARSFAKGGAT